jgi:hypothetical protein
MSYAPLTLTALRTYLAGQTGLSLVSLGIVGNKAHTRGYHLGRDRIYDGSGGPGTGDADYSVKTARDKAGLTDAASAMDIGNFKRLREMSKWLVAEAQRNAPGTRDLREIIYTPDGRVVLRWDRERGYASKPQPGEADDSHLTHTHISWYRDAQSRDKTDLFRRFFQPLPDTGVEMATYKVVADMPTGKLRLADQDGIHYLRLRDNELIEVTDPAAFGIKDPILPVRLDEPIVEGKPATDEWRLGYIVGEDAAFVLSRNVVVTDGSVIAWNAGVTAAAAAAAKAKR